MHLLGSNYHMMILLRMEMGTKIALDAIGNPLQIVGVLLILTLMPFVCTTKDVVRIQVPLPLAAAALILMPRVLHLDLGLV